MLTFKKCSVFFALVCAPLVTVLSGFCLAAPSQSAENFYKGKTIQLIVDQSPGGSTDRTARVLQPYLAQRTGCTVVVQNMFGAGGLEGQNYVWNAAPSGLTLGITLVQNISTDDIVGAPGAHYKVDKYGWIGCAGVESPLFFTSTKGRIKSAADLKVTKNLKFTGMERTAMHSLWSMSIAWLLDLDAKVLTGLSIADTELLILRGEADGSITSPTRFFRGLKAGDQKGLLVITPDGKRNSTVPDLPELRELTKLDAEKMKYYQVTSVVLTNSGKSLCTTPGVPPERLQFLRDTFTWITRQERFNRDMEALMGYAPIQFKSGKELEEEAAMITANRDYLKDKFQFLIKRYAD